MTYSKFFNCENLDSFNTNLESGLITDNSLVFISSTKQIWTHGVSYNCPYSADEIAELFNSSEGKLTGLIDELKAVATTSSNGLMSAADKTNLDNLVNTGGEPNQDAFSKIAVGSTTVEADEATDTLTLVEGDNITLSLNPENDSVTISATDTKYDPATDSVFGVVKIGTAAAKANGTASAGTTTGGLAAAVDHVHPLQESVSGNAGTATKLQSPTNISLSGAVTGSVDFDGSEGVTIATTLSGFDASKITSGIIDIDRLPQGALERLITVSNDAARFALTSDDVQLGDTIKVTETGLMYYVVDVANLDEEIGYEVYTAGAASSVPWSGVTGKPDTYTPSTHTHTKSEITDFPASLKNPNALTISLNGSSQGDYDGSESKSIDITPASIGASAEGHDHNYAGSETPGGSATSAVKLDSNAGSSTRPVYFSGGKPAECGDSLAVDITGNAATATSAASAETASKVTGSLTLKANSTDIHTFDGSADKSLDIVAGENIEITASDNTLTISATGGAAAYTAGTGLSLNDNEFSLAGGVVTAGTVGPDSEVTGSNGATIDVPRITVDEYGRVTSLSSFKFTAVDTDTNTTYTAGTGLSLSAGNQFSLASITGLTTGSYGMSTATTGNDGTVINIPYITVDAYGRITGITNVAYTSKNTTYSVATTAANGLMSSTDKTKLDAIGEIINISKTLTVGTSWVDTGILTSSLDGSGTYVVQVYLNNSATNGAYNGYWSGIMSAYDGAASSTTEDEIVLHCSSKSNGANIYLRTVRQSSAATKLQIASDVSIESTSYTFKFRKLI